MSSKRANPSFQFENQIFSIWCFNLPSPYSAFRPLLAYHSSSNINSNPAQPIFLQGKNSLLLFSPDAPGPAGLRGLNLVLVPVDGSISAAWISFPSPPGFSNHLRYRSPNGCPPHRNELEPPPPLGGARPGRRALAACRSKVQSPSPQPDCLFVWIPPPFFPPSGKLLILHPISSGSLGFFLKRKPRLVLCFVSCAAPPPPGVLVSKKGKRL